MANSTVVTDLVANDKVTEATKQATAAVQQYAQRTSTSLTVSQAQWSALSQSVGKFGAISSQATHGALSMVNAIGSISGSGVSAQVIGTINAMITGLQALTTAQATAQAFMGPKGWAMLAAGAVAAVGAAAMVSLAFRNATAQADEAGTAASRHASSTVAVADAATRTAKAVDEESGKIAKAREQYRLAVEEIKRLREAHDVFSKQAGREAAILAFDAEEAIAKQIERRNAAIKAAQGLDFSTWSQRYVQALKPIQELLREEIISTAEFATQIRRLQDSMGGQVSGIERYRRALADLFQEFREGRRTQEAFSEGLRALADKQFGPLLTESLQSKLVRQLGDIERDFQHRFGRNLTPAQAEAERAARRQEAVRGATGTEKTPQDRLAEALERANVARAAGRGDDADRIRREARQAFSEGLLQAARSRQGLGSPFAGLATDAERLRAELKAIQEAGAQGAFGRPGSQDALEIQRRAIAAALEQHGRKVPEIERPRWEGLADTWKRIQESAAGRGNSPEERAVRVAEANKGVLTQIFGETKEFNKWLQKWFEKKEDNRARAG